MNTNKLETIKERYDSDKKLAKDIWIDGDYEGNDNDFYYFQCGFAAGMNYSLYKDHFNENEKTRKKRLDALQKLSDLDQELGFQ